jgi:hypothetical protein
LSFLSRPNGFPGSNDFPRTSAAGCHSRNPAISMVLQADSTSTTTKKLQKVEALKVKSDYLRHPLKEVRRLMDG